MRRVMWALLMLPASAWAGAFAQDAATRSVQAILPHCAAGVSADAQDVTGGRCAGILATLSFVSRVLPDDLKFCHPNTATPGEMVQVVASFVDSNPDSAMQDFRLVALAAMRDKWPCQE
ncbi:MAG TPA: Rap1a/Tai family immunity protein [Xanthobacteraceae bacterium]